MEKKSRKILLIAPFCAILLSACVDPTTGLPITLSTGSPRTSAPTATPAEGPLTKHDVALRFLTAYIRLDRTMALRYATTEAINKLNWNLSHRGNIPYYNDKMLLQFNGGWARVFFQDMGGTYKITDFEVHSN